MEGVEGGERLECSLPWCSPVLPHLSKLEEDNNKTLARLKRLATRHDFPHLLFHGPAGSGKRTRIYAFIQARYTHTSASIVRPITLVVGPSKKPVQLLQGSHHMECSLLALKESDHHGIQHLFVDLMAFKTDRPDEPKLLVLHDADRLSKQAQAALRRILEEFSPKCRVIFSCQCLTHLIPPLISRCVRIAIAGHDRHLAILDVFKQRGNVGQQHLQQGKVGQEQNKADRLMIWNDWQSILWQALGSLKNRLTVDNLTHMSAFVRLLIMKQQIEPREILSACLRILISIWGSNEAILSPLIEVMAERNVAIIQSTTMDAHWHFQAIFSSFALHLATSS